MSSDYSVQDVTVGGVSLKSLTHIMELADLDATIRKRGDNVPVAFRRGTRWAPKQFDQITRNLTLSVDATNDNGILPTTRTGRLAQLNANVRELQAVLATDLTQVTVQREVVLPDGLGGTTTEVWSASADVVDTAVIADDAATDEVKRLTVPLLFADPLWYGPTKSASVNSGGSVNVVNGGEIIAEWVSVDFVGASTNPRLTNTTGDNVYVEMLLAISGGDRIFVRRGYAYRQSDNRNMIGYLRNSGARSFMQLRRGSNSLSLTGGGSAVISYREPHL